MGTLYKEIVEYKKQKGIRAVLFLGVAIILINMVVLASSLRDVLEEFLLISYVLIPIAASGMAYSWKKYKTRYRYTIIDRELIIEKLNGSKRKIVLNINAKHIQKIEKCRSRIQKEKLWKQYNFLCTGKKECVYNCIYEKNNKLYGFYFEPSTELYNKILRISSNQKIA